MDDAQSRKKIFRVRMPGFRPREPRGFFLRRLFRQGCIASDDPLFREKGFLFYRQVHPRRDNIRFFPAPVPFPAGRFQVPAGGRSPQDLHNFFKGGVPRLPDDDRAHIPVEAGLCEQDLRGDLLPHDPFPRDAFQASDLPEVPKKRQGGHPPQEPGSRGMRRANP